MDHQGDGQPTDKIRDIVKGGFANPFKKGAAALFLVCLDEAGDDYEKIAKLTDALNSYLDELAESAKSGREQNNVTPTT